MSIIDKIRKLRALATSDNLNEAAAAAAAAERLLQEHQINEAELHLAPEESCILDPDPLHTWKHVSSWESQLLSTLAKQYACRCILQFNGDGSKIARIVGRPSDIAVVRYQFAFFRLEIQRLAAKLGKGKGRTWANSFRLGAVQAVYTSLQEATATARTTASSTALATIDGRREATERFYREAFPKVQPRKATTVSFSADGYQAGRDAAGGLNNRSQIGASGNRLLGA